ncbi:MAG TPA: YcxB family protein [Sphingomicrobium sp.]|nr:YcxB family protein [Sphingomicrobium sp.]
MRGTATYRLTEQDVVDAQRAWFDSRLRPPMLAILIGALLVVGSGILLLDPFPGRMDVALAALPVAGLIVAALLFLAPRWAIRRQARRLGQQNRGLALDQSVEWDDRGIGFVSARGQARFAWSEFYRWQITPTLLMLYPDETQFYPLPLRALGPRASEEIGGLLQAAGVDVQGPKRPLRRQPA